ncbi:MAG: hypothetical protein AABW92_03355 [Nanoarchaeota archaeon]
MVEFNFNLQSKVDKANLSEALISKFTLPNQTAIDRNTRPGWVHTLADYEYTRIAYYGRKGQVPVEKESLEISFAKCDLDTLTERLASVGSFLSENADHAWIEVIDVSFPTGIGKTKEPLVTAENLASISAQMQAYQEGTVCLEKVGYNTTPANSVILSWQEIEHQSMADFAKQVKNYGKRELKGILQEGYASHITHLNKKGDAKSRAIAYMATNALGNINEQDKGIESLGWHLHPELDLAYVITTGALARVYLVMKGFNTPRLLHDHLTTFRGQSVGFHVAGMYNHEHHCTVHYPVFHSSPNKMKIELNKLKELGLLNQIQEESYSPQKEAIYAMPQFK